VDGDVGLVAVAVLAAFCLGEVETAEFGSDVYAPFQCLFLTVRLFSCSR